MGRLAVRGALRILKSSGLIRVKKASSGRVFVSDLSTENFSSSFSNIIKLRNISLEDLTEGRIELDKIVLACAIEPMKQEDISTLYESMERAGLNPKSIRVEKNPGRSPGLFKTN